MPVLMLSAMLRSLVSRRSLSFTGLDSVLETQHSGL